MHEGKRVKVYLRNGMTCEGFISKWEKNTAILNALEGSDVLYLPNVSEDVMMVRFFMDDQTGVESAAMPVKAEPLPPIREPELPLVDVPASKQDLRIKKLAELRKIQKKELQQNIANRVKSHVPTNIQRANYVQPSFSKRIPKNNSSS